MTSVVRWDISAQTFIPSFPEILGKVKNISYQYRYKYCKGHASKEPAMFLKIHVISVLSLVSRQYGCC